MLHHRSIAAPALIASALVTGSASADLIQYTFTFSGATGSIGSGPTVDMVGGFTLFADTDDIEPFSGQKTDSFGADQASRSGYECNRHISSQNTAFARLII